jgi:hypothetical protein
MVMDLRRTAFIEDWYLGQTDDTRARVQWFEAPADAAWYSDVTPFRSLDWWDGLPPIQARPGPINRRGGTYTKGNPIANYKGTGPPCGSASWWVNGIPPGTPKVPTDENGVPECCSNIASLTFHFVGSSPWQFVSFEPGIVVRQFAAGGNAFDQLTVRFTVPTLGTGALVASIASNVFPGGDKPIVTPAPGFHLVQEIWSGLQLTQQWLYPNAPSLQTFTFTVENETNNQPRFWSGIVATEVNNLYAGGIVDGEGQAFVFQPFTNPVVTYPLGYYWEVVITTEHLQDQPSSYATNPAFGYLVGFQGAWQLSVTARITNGDPRENVNVGADTWSVDNVLSFSMPGYVQPFWYLTFELEANSAFNFVGNSYIVPAFHDVLGDFTVAWDGGSLAGGAFTFTEALSISWHTQYLVPTTFSFTEGFTVGWVTQYLVPTTFAFTEAFTATFVGQAGGPTTDILNTPGSGTWTVPAGVTTLISVECTGGGAAGGSGLGAGGGGGGGGMAIASGVSVTPGHVYNIYVAFLTSTGGVNGDVTWFNTSGYLQAAGGNSTASGTGGAGGSGSGSALTTSFTGGSGANSVSPNGGGGGGAAGNTQNGHNGSGSTGATAVDYGGSGGNGSTTAGQPGSSGSSPGGGGGGKHQGSPGAGNTPGAGNQGEIRITF